MALLLVIPGLALWLVPAPVSRPPEGLVVVARAPTFIRLQGEARLGRPARGESETVDGAASLEPYDAIETGAQGRAAITWPRGAAATLEPDSRARLLPGSADGTVRLELQRGGVWLSTGPDAGSALVELSTPDAVRVVGQRFRARRDQAGRLVLTTVDVAVDLCAQDTRHEVPAGATSEVLAGRRPTLARPVAVPRALAVTVDGPPAWLLLDRYGRAVGAPPGGGPWLDQLPAARGPLPRPEGAGVLVPDPEGEYQLILWAGEAPRVYRVAAWPTQGQALFGGTPPREPPAAARFEGRVATGSATVLGFTLQERAVVAVRPAQVADELPTMLRVAFALAAPPGAAAQSDPPATSYSIDAEAPPPTEVSGAPSGVSGDGSATGAPAPAPAGGNAPAASAGAPAQPLSGAAARSAPSSAAAQPAVRDLTSRSGVDASAANPPENQAADAAAPSPAPEVSSFSRSFVMGMPTALPPTQPPSQLPGGAASTFSSAVPPSPIAPPSAADRSPVPTVAAQPQARVPPTPGSAGPGGPAAVSQPTGASVGSAAGLGTLAENASGDLPVAPSLSGTAGPLPPPLGRRGAGATAGRVSATATASPARLLPGGADRATTPVPGSATAGTTPGVRTH